MTVRALPYLALLGLFAALTLLASWRGLQPLDGWIPLAAYLAYLAQALVRGHHKGEDVGWSPKEVGLSVAGLVALALDGVYVVCLVVMLVWVLDVL